MDATCAIDASDNARLRQRSAVPLKEGPERKRYSDPDASWGHRSAVSTRKGGGFYGYRLHAGVCARTDLPVAWQVSTAGSHESNYVASLLDTMRERGLTPETCALDMGYDTGRYDACEERDCRPIIPCVRHRPSSAASIARRTVSMASGGLPRRRRARVRQAQERVGAVAAARTRP